MSRPLCCRLELSKASRTQFAGGTFPAAGAGDAVIAGHGRVLDDVQDAELRGERPLLCLGHLEERRHDLDRVVEREANRLLFRTDKDAAAVGIAREVRLTHTRVNLGRPERLRPHRRKLKENRVAPFNDGIWRFKVGG